VPSESFGPSPGRTPLAERTFFAQSFSLCGSSAGEAVACSRIVFVEIFFSRRSCFGIARSRIPDRGTNEVPLALQEGKRRERVSTPTPFPHRTFHVAEDVGDDLKEDPDPDNERVNRDDTSSSSPKAEVSRVTLASFPMVLVATRCRQFSKRSFTYTDGRCATNAVQTTTAAATEVAL